MTVGIPESSGSVAPTSGSSPNHARSTLAWIALAAGLIAAAGAVLVGLMSFTLILDTLSSSETIGFAALAANVPVAIAGLVVGILGLKSPRRAVAIVGLGLCAFSLVALAAMIALAG